MQPYPRSPDLVWLGHLHDTGCLSTRAVGTGFPTVGLRLCFAPGCGWVWVLFTPASPGWGLGWVCLNTVCGVVPLLPAVFGLPGRACWARVSAVTRPSWLGCRGVFFALFFFALWCRLLGVPVPGLVVCSPIPFLLGWAAGFFFCCVCLHVSVPLFPVGRCSWLGVAGFGWVVPLCLFGGPVFGAFWVGGLAALCVVGGRIGGCGLFSRPPPSAPGFL